MDREIEKLSERLEREEISLKEKANEIKEDGKISMDISKEKLDLSVSGVDGGFSRKKLRGIELVITRSCLVEMKYEDNKLINHSYFPDSNPSPNLYSYDIREENSKKPQILRMNEEITTALKYINGDPNVDMLILDGSIVPNPHNKPKESSEERENYYLLVKKYEELFRKSLDKGIQLIGAVEDSKSRKVSKKKGVNSLDNILLHHVLDKGQRTPEFNYSDEPGKHPVLSDFSMDISNRIKFMYLKPVEEDTPLRIEYLSGTMNSEKIASVVQEVSKISNSYSYPVPLMEADLHAKLTEKETDLIIRRIKNQAGENPVLMEKRRNTRPFH